ncbi:MAG: NADH-quinone oxidoreductase subunit L, partial [Cyanobacteria bacterium NC_groundwater_1444_Ag_S-0.65um_54_12]|nr:NADH-quinone oxidoreductase subunit L [Cyanobacteria bacterium NC_groundwater_1444_Ag_S-0.65um_54_12]
MVGNMLSLLVPSIPLITLAIAGICGLLWLSGERRAAIFNAVTMSGLAIMLLATIWLFMQVVGGVTIGRLELPFLQLGQQELAVALRVDSLSALMLLVVAVVSLLVQLYSTSYLAGDNGYGRYFAFINLFTFAMLALVVVDDLLSIYMCWELVGLGSYLLIGHWYQKPEAAQAAKKAFVVTRIGDFGFLLGILVLWQMFGTLDLTLLAEKVQHLELAKGLLGLAPTASLLLAMVLLFWGPIGKSAQFPLHVWLPDAMEGPTPVSALIHAATMVAAGVYLTARTMFLFTAAPSQALLFVGWIGGITALLAALMALGQWDIKRILAYSTVSQLGYMMLALGFGTLGLAAAIFHLFNHAFFKALLFLGAGSVIHATHSQDIREMGGLRRYLPWTFWPFTIATLSLSGVPLLSGFWSKDAILGLAFAHDRLLWAIGTLVAGLTAFYMFRLWFYTFTGNYRGKNEHHVHESPWAMTLPLGVLAVPAIFSGYWGIPWANRFNEFLLGGLAHAPGLAHAAGAHSTHASGAVAGEHAQQLIWGLPGQEVMVMAISTVIALAGIAIAWRCYATRPPRQFFAAVQAADPVPLLAEPLERLGLVWTLLSRKFFFDECYAWVRDRIFLGGAAICNGFDRYVVDGIVNLIALGNLGLGEGLRQTTSGKVQTYLW